jgi:YHS domain-containing protein
MNKNIWIVTCLAAAILSGCNTSQTPAASTSKTPTVAASASAAPTTVAHAYEEGSIKKGDMVLCAICVVNGGETAKEAAVETIDYEGKTYAFCNEEEKAIFISEPKKYAAK